MKDLTGAAADHFSYLIVYAPEFPAEDATDVNRECQRLLGMLQEIEQRAGDTPKKQWLKLAITETVQARDAFASNDATMANDLLHAAEEHFRAYLAGKQARPSFIGGPDGTIEKV